jgi:hypothetical protein
MSVEADEYFDRLRAEIAANAPIDPEPVWPDFTTEQLTRLALTPDHLVDDMWQKLLAEL